MPGFLRSLARAAIDGYNNAKEQQAQAQRDAYGQTRQGYASPQQQGQQSPTLPPRHSPQQNQQQQQNVNTQPALPPRSYSSPSPGCNGLEAIQGGKIFVTSIAPELDICPSCYQVFIRSSPFASHFTLVPDPNPGRKTCDMAIKAIRDAWKDASARCTSLQDQTIWLQRFAQQAQQIMDRVNQLVATISTLKEQIQLATLQAQFTQASAMNQIQHGFSMSCINSIGGGNYYDGGSVIQAAGNERFARATQMKMDVHVKEYELKRVVGEFRALVGCDEGGRAMWL